MNETTSKSFVTEDSGARSVLFEYIKQPEFKRLLNQVVNSQQETGFRSISILSLFEGEGKTFFSSVLALGYALYLGRRVLIVDTVSQSRTDSFFTGRVLADSRFPRDKAGDGVIDLVTRGSLLRKIQIGLGQARTEESHINTIMRTTSDFKIAQVLESLRSSYDLIIIDTCSLSDTKKDNLDPVIVAKQTDTSLIITSEKSLEKDRLEKMKRELASAGVTPLAMLTNNKNYLV